MTGFVHTVLLTAAQAPLPRDLGLPLPLGEWELKFFLVVLFLVHILFVNFMVGGSLLSVFFEILGLTWSRFDTLGRRIAETITVNKSLAVVLGVGPLLCINLVYTTHFYSANALTGYAWLSIVPLVTVAFLLVYLHKYTWASWTGPSKRLHLLVGGLGAFLFLSIPFIFLANINLMLFPDKWAEVREFFSSLRVGNVFPRYFHFLSASLALTALFLAGFLTRKGYPIETALPEFGKQELRGIFYRVAFFVTLAQLIFGPLVLFTLPYVGLTVDLFILVTIGIAIAVVFLYLLWREIKSGSPRLGGAFVRLCLVLVCVLGIMVTARHMYRETSLAAHKQAIQGETARFHAIETATKMRIQAGLGAGDALGGGPTGEKIFRNCAACHAVNKVLAAPSLTEVYALYRDNPEGIVTWAEAPGKKRAEFAPMPSFKHLGEEQLRLVADYILDVGGQAAGEVAPPQ